MAFNWKGGGGIIFTRNVDGYFWRGGNVVPYLQVRRRLENQITENNLGMGAN